MAIEIERRFSSPRSTSSDRGAHSPTRLWLTLAAVAALVCSLYVGPVHAAGAVQSSAKPQSRKLTIDPKEVQKPWTGDLDGMMQRRIIRVLTIYSKTFYFTDKGTQRGLVYQFFHQFEKELNKKWAKKHLKVKVFFIPVARDQLFPALVAGNGEFAAAHLTITAEREKLVDFSVPGLTDVSQVVVSGPASPKLPSVDDLAGKEVFVRKSSAYYESLVALNQRFAAQQRPAVNIKLAPEQLEDEDLAEMVNAGLIPLIVMDKHVADFWKQVLPKITVHDEIAIRTGGEIAWAIREGSPQLKAALDDYVVRHRKGKHDPSALPEERKICQGRRIRVRSQEIFRPGSIFPGLRRQVLCGLVVDGRSGIPGIPP
jgi:ABC-type amino acid transport substrate-binding protein